MAHSLSARKRVRQDIRRRGRNRWYSERIKQAIREFDQALLEGKTDEAAGKLRAVYKQLDQIAAKGPLHKNAAARKKSRLAKRLNKASQPAPA